MTPERLARARRLVQEAFATTKPTSFMGPNLRAQAAEQLKDEGPMLVRDLLAEVDRLSGTDKESRLTHEWPGRVTVRQLSAHEAALAAAVNDWARAEVEAHGRCEGGMVIQTPTGEVEIRVRR